MIGRRRRGYTLVEVVVVMGTGAAILVLGAMMIQGLLKLDRASRDRIAEGATLGRLARSLRSDAHAALGARATPGDGKAPARLDLTLPGGRVATYRVGGREVRREVDDAGEPDGFERFRLPGGTTARLDLRDEGGRRVLSLALDRPPGPGGEAALRGLRVEAVVGRDHRFEGDD